jgi:predicted  nucleic acid-binding Zn-ribbon protein
MEKSNDVNTEIDNLKSEIQELENYYTTYLSSIEEREARWKGFEKKIEENQQ